MMRVKVTGLKETVAGLRTVNKQLPARVTKALRVAAEPIKATAREMAPVGGDGDPHPGRLRGTVRTFATQTRAGIRVGDDSTPYAWPIVGGWKARNITPNPFPFKAADEHASSVAPVVQREIQKLINDAGLGAR